MKADVLAKHLVGGLTVEIEADGFDVPKVEEIFPGRGRGRE